MKEINPPAGADDVNLDLDLMPGGKVKVRAVDAQGQPVAGVLAAGRSKRDRHDREPQKDAEFESMTSPPARIGWSPRPRGAQARQGLPRQAR